MKRYGLFLFLLVAGLVWTGGCSHHKSGSERAKALDRPFNPQEYNAELQGFLSRGLLSEQEGDWVRMLVEGPKGQLADVPSGWTYGELLRRGQGLDSMKHRAVEARLVSISLSDEEDPAIPEETMNLVAGMEFKNRTGQDLDHFSVMLEFLDEEGHPYFNTNYFTYLRPLSPDEKTQAVPFHFQVPPAPEKDARKHFKAILSGEILPKVNFILAGLRFQDGKSLEEYWLDPAR